MLSEHPLVEQALVVARDIGQGGSSLVAYVQGSILSQGWQEVLRAHLRQRLPDYMLPSFWVGLEQFPLTPNGKIDRKALPEPHKEQSQSATAGVEFTPTEELLAGIFCDVLKLEQVATEDNFFELGGHSLLATQVVSRVRRAFSVEMSVRKLFEYPTAAELAAHIDSLSRQGLQIAATIGACSSVGRSELSFAQSRLWFLDQMEPDTSAYNIPLALSLKGRLSLPALEQSINEITRRHEALRTVFLSKVGELRQLTLPNRFRTIQLVDLSALEPSQQQQVSQGLVTGQAARSFDLSTGPLIRASLIKQDHALSPAGSHHAPHRKRRLEHRHPLQGAILTL